MLNINFVPDDYIQNNESRRTNLIYLLLFVIIMAALGGSFITIKIRQRMMNTREDMVNAKMTEAQQAIGQFEQLQARHKVMIKTALTTTELLEPVPRSALLALLTNNLPQGVSLLRLNLVQKTPKTTSSASRYQAAQQQKTAVSLVGSVQRRLETHIGIEGIAPSDRQVAEYIGRLNSSPLLDSVALVESKEHKINDTSRSRKGSSKTPGRTFRQFKLTAMLRQDTHLTEQDVKDIKFGT